MDDSADSSASPDAKSPKAYPASCFAVLNYRCDGIGRFRSIEYGTNAARHISQVADVIADNCKYLLEHFWECVADFDLESLHESFGVGEYPEDGWGYSDVAALVERIGQSAAEEFSRSGSPFVRGTSWYELICWLNESYYPNDSGIWVSVEGTIGEGLIELLSQEVDGYTKLSELDDRTARWLGRLAVISRWNWQLPIERQQWQALRGVVDDFNAANNFF